MTYVPTNVSTPSADFARCPSCEGRGYMDTEENQSGRTWVFGAKGPFVPYCPTCKGAKIFDRNKVCACGGPAVYHDSTLKVDYCGREACMRAQEFRAKRQQNNLGLP